MGRYRCLQTPVGCRNPARRWDADLRQRCCGDQKVSWNPGLKSPRLIVMEATGGHEYAAAVILSKAGLPVAIANPRQVRAFARAKGKLAKTDPIDAETLAHFGEAMEPPVRAVRDQQL